VLTPIRNMRIPALLIVLAIVLVIAVIALIGFGHEASSIWELWILRGAAVVLCIGILLTGGQICSIPLKDRVVSLREQLSASEIRFQAFFNDPAVGIGILGLDRRLVDANPTLFSMFGRTREEMIGMNSAEVTYPDDDPVSAQLFVELLRGERDLYEADRRYIRKNGEIFWAHVTMSIVRGSDNAPRYLVGVMMDIDKQKRDALALEKSQARFQALFDNLAVGIAVTTLDGRPIAFNPVVEKITGYTAEDIQQIDSLSLVVPDDRERDSALFKELIAGKRRSYVNELRYQHKNGNVLWTRINYSLVHDPEGNPDYLVIIIEDINEQKRAAETLAAQEAEYLLTLQGRVQERTQELEEANQRLQNEVEQRIKIEKELAEKAALEAVAADRTRLARDLHDAVTQTLFSSSLIAEVLPDLWEMDIDEAKRSTEELRQLTRGALAEMRTLLLELRPSTLTQTSLNELIAQLCEAFIGRTRLNIFKYARATEVKVSLIVSADKVYFEVRDNGVGFDLSVSKPTSLGTRIMRERAETIGADFQITSIVGAGTSVEVTWNES